MPSKVYLLVGPRADDNLHYPPTCQIAATIDTLHNVLEEPNDTEELKDLNEDMGDSVEICLEAISIPAPLRPWQAMSTYECYMVETDASGEEELDEEMLNVPMTGTKPASLEMEETR